MASADRPHHRGGKVGVGKGSGRIPSGDDFTVRGGAGDASIGGKQGYSERRPPGPGPRQTPFMLAQT